VGSARWRGGGSVLGWGRGGVSRMILSLLLLWAKP